jgi:hypothetical protein
MPIVWPASRVGHGFGLRDVTFIVREEDSCSTKPSRDAAFRDYQNTWCRGGGIYKVSISRKVPIRLYHVTLNCQPPTKLDPGSGRSSPTFLRPTTFVYSTQICASTALVWLRYIPTSSMGVGIITSLAIITASIRGNKFTSFKLMFNQSNSSPDMS